MNFTIEQKEEITRIIADILLGIKQADAATDCIQADPRSHTEYIKTVKSSLEYVKQKTDELKQYLMEIDNGRTEM